jgi:hypothetical protein
MLKFLEKLKSYPEDTKRLAVLSFAGVLTFIIVSVNFVLPGHFIKTTEVADPNANLSSPFAMVKQEFSGSFSKMAGEMFSSLRSGLVVLTAVSSQKNASATSSDESAAAATTTPETDPTLTSTTTAENISTSTLLQLTAKTKK